MKLWCCLTWWHQGLKVQPSRQQVSCMYISYCSTSYMVLNKYQDTNNLIAEVQFLLFLRFLLWQSPAGHCRTASASAHHWTCRCLNCKCKPARVAELKTIYIYCKGSSLQIWSKGGTYSAPLCPILIERQKKVLVQHLCITSRKCQIKTLGYWHWSFAWYKPQSVKLWHRGSK